MGVVRTVVFPALRLVVWALIAVALLWIAFVRTGNRDTDAAATASAVVQPPATSITRGDVVNTVALQGTIQADPATTVKATAAGQVGKVRAEVGQAVEKGTPLFTVVVTVEPPATSGTGATTGDPTAAPTTPPAATTKTVTVTSTVAGTLATLDVLAGQDVTVGQAAATVSPGTLTVSAPLTQAQQYRLLKAPTSAQVTVPGGPGTFECTGLRTGTPPSTGTDGSAGGSPSGFDPYTGMPADPSTAMTGANVTCAVPAGVQVFAGLSAAVDVTAGQAQGVLLAPVTAVQGTVGNGKVWTVGEDGATTETPVTLGLTDGQNVEITGGVTEGQQVLQFVPGTDTPTDPGGMYGMGS
ncbi:efflux RND transporter periplasmic adaptor subunit [Kineococcus sp. NPDC059986]|uniref:efflux RND transporter periplasmic adaptor subunit n=1 Tax=Kineococcus sp. NPDC059986 TaxID=3155538 RepID=UPI00344BFFA2